MQVQHLPRHAQKQPLNVGADIAVLPSIFCGAHLNPFYLNRAIPIEFAAKSGHIARTA
jgi:hypothetical protein